MDAAAELVVGLGLGPLELDAIELGDLSWWQAAARERVRLLAALRGA